MSVCRVVCKRYDGGGTFDQNELSVAAGTTTAGRRIVIVILYASDGNRLYLASDEERGVACTEGFGLLVEIQVRIVVVLDFFGNTGFKQQRFRRNGEVVDGELIRLVVVGYQQSSLLKGGQRSRDPDQCQGADQTAVAEVDVRTVPGYILSSCIAEHFVDRIKDRSSVNRPEDCHLAVGYDLCRLLVCIHDAQMGTVEELFHCSV